MPETLAPPDDAYLLDDLITEQMDRIGLPTLPKFDMLRLLEYLKEVLAAIQKYLRDVDPRQKTNDGGDAPQKLENDLPSVSLRTLISSRIQMYNILNELDLGHSLATAVDRLQPLTDIIHETLFLPIDDDDHHEVVDTEPVGVHEVVAHLTPVVSDVVRPETPARPRRAHRKLLLLLALDNELAMTLDLDDVDGVLPERVRELTDLTREEYALEEVLRLRIHQIHRMDVDQKAKNTLVTRLMMGNYVKHNEVPELTAGGLTGRSGTPGRSTTPVRGSSLAGEVVGREDAGNTARFGGDLEAAGHRNEGGQANEGAVENVNQENTDSPENVSNPSDTSNPSHPSNPSTTATSPDSQPLRNITSTVPMVAKINQTSDSPLHDPIENEIDPDDEDAGSIASSDEVVLTEEDCQPLYHSPNVFGCTHYQRNCKIECPTCRQWFVCRFCHDASINTHKLVRSNVTHILCMFCGTPQEPDSNDCVNCDQELAQYFCRKCVLYDNDPTKDIYHCDKCGICRLGLGLGMDYFHCDTCNICLLVELKSKHKCVANNTHSNCPICNEYMFTLVKKVVFMRCGHLIHQECYDDMVNHSYKCPICKKTVANVEPQFRILDLEIANQPLPAPYNQWRCIVSCNDCNGKSNVPYHVLGLRCNYCRSYNTNQLRLIKEDEDDDPTEDGGLDEGVMQAVRRNIGANFRIGDTFPEEPDGYQTDEEEMPKQLTLRQMFQAFIHNATRVPDTDESDDDMIGGL